MSAPYTPTYRDQVALVALKLLVEHRSWKHLDHLTDQDVIRHWTTGAFMVADNMIAEGKKESAT